MTEDEWLANENPHAMLAFVDDRASNRKLRLFVCACARTVCDNIQLLNTALQPTEAGPSWSMAVGASEQFADGLIDAEMLENARAVVVAEFATGRDFLTRMPGADDLRGALAALDVALEAAQPRESAAAETVLRFLRHAPWRRWVFENWIRGSTADPFGNGTAAILREIFGNPFRSPILDPAWLIWNAGTIPKLAECIYDERRFADMPLLGKALEEAGCTDPAILEHCREVGEHVRGCWVVDNLLGKS